jgi:cyclic pyranopterin phosphate synthase
MKMRLTHVGMTGEARMVDITDKSATERVAVAAGRVRVSRALLALLRGNALAKGDALAAARIAGVMAAKRASELIPLCHPLPLAFVGIELDLEDEPPSVAIRATVRTHYSTGVEMEALTAVAVAALTIYDMGKSVDRAMTIDEIQLLEKSGGRSGKWKRNTRKP